MKNASLSIIGKGIGNIGGRWSMSHGLVSADTKSGFVEDTLTI